MTRRVRRASFFSTPVKTNNKTQDVPLRVSLAKQPLIPGNRAGCMGFFTPASTIQNCHVLIWQNLYNTMAWLRQETGGGAAVRIAAGFYQGCNAERLYQNQNHSEGCSAHQGQGAGVQNSAALIELDLDRSAQDVRTPRCPLAKPLAHRGVAWSGQRRYPAANIIPLLVLIDLRTMDLDRSAREATPCDSLAKHFPPIEG